MPTPYNTTRTGVQIGRLYIPQQRPHHDRDAIRLQNALLGRRPATDWDGIAIAAVCIVAIVAALVWFHA